MLALGQAPKAGAPPGGDGAPGGMLASGRRVPLG